MRIIALAAVTLGLAALSACNTADQVRAAGENHADAVRNGADADGNSAN